MKKITSVTQPNKERSGTGMRWGNIIGLSIGILFCVSGHDARASDVADAVLGVVGCSQLKDDKDRLDCFDKAALTLKTAGIPNGPETASTKDVIASFAPNDFKVVDPDDLHVAPRKFVGKPVELRNVRCFYADKDDYRCIAPSGTMITTIFGKSISPPNEKDALEADCGAIKKVGSVACEKIIRIVPTDFAEDMPNAFGKRVGVQVTNIEIVGRPARSRR